MLWFRQAKRSLPVKVPLLFVLQEFPPPVAGGNMRFYKFAKYLSRWGWDVSVICKGRRKEEALREIPALAKDLSGVTVIGTADIKERFAETLGRHRQDGRAAAIPVCVTKKSDIGREEGKARGRNPLVKALRFLQKLIVPDSGTIAWAGFAFRVADRLIGEGRIATVITSSPPHSTQLVGLWLKRKYGDRLKWIADFRDLWNLSPGYDLGLMRRRTANRRLERKVIRSADACIFVSTSMRDEVLKSLGFGEGPESAKCDVITNGFDEEDFAGIVNDYPGSSEKTLDFCYFGTVDGPRVENSFPDGVVRYFSQRPDSRMRLKFFGNVDRRFSERFAGLSSVEFLANMPHDVSLKKMATADALVLILTNDLEGRIAFTGKFFEYLRMKKPILAIVPDGEVSNVVTSEGIGVVANPDDPDSIAKALWDLEDRIIAGKYPASAFDNAFAVFERGSLSERLSDLIIATRVGRR